jgi:putative hydrolase of the HAD superfamily
MKKYLWFDLGYTLLYLNRETAYRQALLEQAIDIPLDEIERAFHYVDKIFMREFPGLFGRAPETYMPWFLGRLNYQLGIKVDIFMIQKRWLEIRHRQPRQWEAYDFCKETLEDLKTSGYKLGVISNWDPSARLILDEHDLSRYFDTIVISSEAGFEKPAPEIFHTAFELSGFGPEHGLYIGDNYYDDAIGSKAVGMDYCIINRFGRFGVEELKESPIISDIREVKSYLEDTV